MKITWRVHLGLISPRVWAPLRHGSYFDQWKIVAGDSRGGSALAESAERRATKARLFRRRRERPAGAAARCLRGTDRPTHHRPPRDGRPSCPIGFRLLL